MASAPRAHVYVSVRRRSLYSTPPSLWAPMAGPITETRSSNKFTVLSVTIYEKVLSPGIGRVLHHGTKLPISALPTQNPTPWRAGQALLRSSPKTPRGTGQGRCPRTWWRSRAAGISMADWAALSHAAAAGSMRVRSARKARSFPGSRSAPAARPTRRSARAGWRRPGG